MPHPSCWTSVCLLMHFWKHIFLDEPVIRRSGSVQRALNGMGESFMVSFTRPKIWSKSIKHIMLFQIFSCGNKIRTWLMITRKMSLMTFVFQEWGEKSATWTFIRFTDTDSNLHQRGPNEWAKCEIKVSKDFTAVQIQGSSCQSNQMLISFYSSIFQPKQHRIPSVSWEHNAPNSLRVLLYNTNIHIL